MVSDGFFIAAVKNDSEIQTSLFLFIYPYWLLLTEYFCVNLNFKANKILLVMFMR